MGILQELQVSGDRLFNRLETRQWDVRFGESLVFSPVPLVSYLGPQSTGEFSSDLSPPEILDTWQVSFTKTALLAAFGTEASFLSALRGNMLYYVRRRPSGDWVRVRSFGTHEVDAGDRYQIVLKSLGFADIPPNP